MSPVDAFLAQFDFIITSAFASLHDPVFMVFSTLLAIGLTLYFSFSTLDGTLSISGIAQRLIWIAFWVSVIHGAQAWADDIGASFVHLGLMAGGNQLSVDEFFSPGNIANIGLERSEKLFGEIDRLSSSGYMGSGTVQYLAEIATLWVAGWLINVAFFLLSIAVFASIVVYKLITLAVFISLMFVGWEKTWFLTAGAIGGLFNGAIKLFAFALILSVVLGVVDAMPIPDIPTRAAIGSQVLTALVIIGLSVFGGSSVAGVFSGAARGMGLGAAVSATISTIGAVTAPAMAVGGAARSSGAAAEILKAGGNAAGQTLSKTGDTMAAIRSGANAAGSAAQGGGARMAARRGGGTHAAHAARLVMPDDDSGSQMNASSMGIGR